MASSAEAEAFLALHRSLVEAMESQVAAQSLSVRLGKEVGRLRTQMANTPTPDGWLFSDDEVSEIDTLCARMHRC